jgi:hypothetical protein
VLPTHGYFERTFEAHGSVAVVRTPQLDTLDWLEEFLGPWFRAGPVVAGDIARETDAIVTLDTSPGSFSRWRPSAQLTGRDAEYFTLDSGEEHWPTARGADGTEWAFDEATAVAVGVSSDGEGRSRIDVLADAERPRGRMTLMRVLRECASARALSRGELPMHAAAVAVGDRVSLFVGPKRSGKSTLLVHALSHAGTTYVSNDRVFVQLEARGATARGMPSIVSLRAGTLDFWPALRADVSSGCMHFPSTLDEARAHREAGTASRPPSTRAIPGLSPAQFCALLGVPASTGGRLERIVFPTVDAALTGAPGFRLQPLTAEDAGTRLAELGLLAGGRMATQLTRIAPPVRGELESAARALARAVPCLSCKLGPDAYSEPSVWNALRAASA